MLDAVIPGRALRANPESRGGYAGLDSGFVTIGPRFARTRWRRPGMTEQVHLQNFTVGTCSTSLRVAPRSKNSLRVKPKAPANSAAGICWIPVLYSWTALLKKRRLAAILFSRSDSSLCNCWKLALALRSGYASDSAISLPSEALSWFSAAPTWAGPCADI